MVKAERVDIVNAQDEVIGQTSKFEAHKKGLLHRTVIAEVIGSDGKWTLIQQAADRQDAGQFVSPIGGHVRAGETEDNALKREASEEYGLPNDINFRLVGKAIFNREVLGRKENHFFILYEIYSDATPVLNEESVAYKVFSKVQICKELPENPKKFGDAFRFVVKTFYPELLA
jgi:isopentenyl-diphosphate Delta-isomerase